MASAVSPSASGHVLATSCTILAQQRGHAEEEVCALLRERVAPGLEDLVGLLDGLRRQLLRRLVEAADDLGLARGVEALKDVAGLDPLAADDERVLAPQLRADALQRLAHRLRVLLFREVRERLVAELFVLHLLHTLLLVGNDDCCVLCGSFVHASTAPRVPRARPNGDWGLTRGSVPSVNPQSEIRRLKLTRPSAPASEVS